MSVETILLDFSISPDLLINNGITTFEKEVVNSLESYLGVGSLVSLKSQAVISAATSNPGFLSLFSGPRGCIATVRIYTGNGLVTINLEYFKNKEEIPLLELKDCAELERMLSKKGQTMKKVKTLPPIRRGIPFERYFSSTDDRILEYDTDAVLYDKTSEFQHIQILHTLSFGNILILNDDPNMAESDLIYTESIMRRGVECYEGKDILILGGGDGGLLKELTKENPRMVVMIEIDEMVVQACKEHLRGTCGEILDNYTGKNYEVIIGDCFPFLSKCIEEDRKFDYVVSDLTAIPISTSPEELETLEFIKNILNLSFRILRADGKFLTHGHATPCRAAEKMYAEILKGLNEPVHVNKIDAFIPSFMESWTFYQIQRK